MERLDSARHREILAAEGRLVASLPPDSIDLPVPVLPDWTVERVVRHLGKLHQWVRGVLDLAPGAGMDEVGDLAGLPRGAASIEAYGEELDALLAALDDRDPDEPRPTFAGDGTVGWWTRRQAHEVAVHRIDAHEAVHAAGGPAPTAMAVDAAADGIDEWATFFLATRFDQRFGALPAALDGRRIHIHGTDDPPPPVNAEWLLAFADGQVAVTTEHAKGDVALRGRAEDLLLVLWRRRPLEVLDLVGERAVAEQLLDVARF